MTFHWPHMLWLLLLPAGLAVRELTRRAREAGAALPKVLRAEASPGGLSLSGAARETAGAPRVRWRLWLGLSLAVFALARPQWGQVEEQVFDQAREILIAVDLSRSMLAPDVPPSRLARAKLLITSLLERLEGERVGLIVFAGTGFLQSPLSADYEILREFLPALGPDFLPQGGTNYDGMLQTALDAFGQSGDADRFLIVLSDGESHTDDWQKRVSGLRERKVKVIGLGIGTSEGAMLPDGRGGFVKDERGAVVLSRLNPGTLEDLARRTGGVYRDASSWLDLPLLLEQTVEAGRQGEFTEASQVRRMERFQWILAPALLVLLWSLWREYPVHPRPRAVPFARGGRREHNNPLAQGAIPAVAIAGLAGLLLLTPSPAAPEENPFAAPLTQLIGRLAAQDAPSAADYAEMAEATLSYGERMIGSGEAPEPGAVIDALQAVDAGDALDPQAANWADLRERLEALRPPEEPPPEPQDSPESDDDGGEQQDQPQDQQSGEGKPQDDASSPRESSDQPDSAGETPDQPSDGPPPENDGREGEAQQPSSEKGRPAFGDMESPAATEPPPQPDAGETQSVGGQSERRPRHDPALAVPLQKLEQLKQHDSPAKLYQLMQDPNARPPDKGSDW